MCLLSAIICQADCQDHVIYDMVSIHTTESHVYGVPGQSGSPFVKLPFLTEWQWPEHEIIGARTLPAVQDARCALRQWTEEHPNETEPDLLEALFLLLDVVEKRIGKGAQEVQSRRELVGQGA